MVRNIILIIFAIAAAFPVKAKYISVGHSIDGIIYGITFDEDTWHWNDAYAEVREISGNPSVVTIPETIVYSITGDGNHKIFPKVNAIGKDVFRTEEWPDVDRQIKTIVIQGSPDVSDGAFMNLPKLELIDFGNCTTIGGCVNCPSLKSVKCSANVTTIGRNAFKGCTALEFMPALWSLKYIEGNAFNGCTSLKRIEGSTWNVARVDTAAFKDCLRLETLPESKRETIIRKLAFENCENLRSLAVTPVAIGDSAFIGCKSLVSVGSSIHPALSSIWQITGLEIGAHAFYNAVSLKEVSTYDTHYKLGDSAFEGCVSLEGFNKPISQCGKSIFKNCINLKEAYLDESTCLNDSIFYNCKSLTRFEFKSYSGNNIPPYAFSESGIRTIDIPQQVRSIEYGAFENCNDLESVNIHSLCNLWWKSFFNCPSLREFKIDSSIPSAVPYSFGGTTDIRNCHLSVPEGLIPQYLDDEIWRQFKMDYIMADSVRIKVADSFTYNDTIYVLGSKADLIAECVPDKALTPIDWDFSQMMDSKKFYVSNPYTDVTHRSVMYDYSGLSEPYTVTISSPFNSWPEVHATLRFGARLTQNIKFPEQYKNLVLPIGCSLKLEAQRDGTIQDIEFSSSDPGVATYVDGIVTGHNIGKATIYCRTLDGTDLVDSCQVTVGNYIKNIEVDESLELWAGEQYQLRPALYPSTADNLNLIYSSGSEHIATVDSNGLITAHSPGSTFITIKATDDFGAEKRCEVNVPKPISDIKIIDKDTLIVCNTIGYNAIVNVYPNDATHGDELEFISTNPDVLVVSDSRYENICGYNSHSCSYEGIAPGNATIIVRSKDKSGISTNFDVTVKEAGFTFIKSLSFYEEDHVVPVGKKYQLLPIFTPSNATDKSLEWLSSDTSIASVNDMGLITGISKGDALITAVTKDGTNLSAYLTVHIQEVMIDYIQVSPPSLELICGSQQQLEYQISPYNATNTTLLWTTDNPGIARVNEEGVVTAVGIGHTWVRATSTDGSGVSGSAYITVPEISVESVVFDLNHVDGKEGEQIQINATVLPEDATNKALAWASSDKSVATVDETGLISLLKKGTAVITASATDGSNVSAECAVVVTDDSGIDDILTDKNTYVRVFNLQGVPVYEGIYSVAKLVPDYYIVVCDGKSTKVKVK